MGILILHGCVVTMNAARDVFDSGFVLVKSDDGAEAWRTLQDHYADFKTSLGPHDLHSLLALMEIEWPDLVGAHHGRLRAFVESDATYYAF